jgi:hypothetical protein
VPTHAPPSGACQDLFNQGERSTAEATRLARTPQENSLTRLTACCVEPIGPDDTVPVGEGVVDVGGVEPRAVEAGGVDPFESTAFLLPFFTLAGLPAGAAFSFVAAAFFVLDLFLAAGAAVPVMSVVFEPFPFNIACCQRGREFESGHAIQTHTTQTDTQTT